MGDGNKKWSLKLFEGRKVIVFPLGKQQIKHRNPKVISKNMKIVN